jgi:hypothetical protein
VEAEEGRGAVAVPRRVDREHAEGVRAAAQAGVERRVAAAEVPRVELALEAGALVGREAEDDRGGVPGRDPDQRRGVTKELGARRGAVGLRSGLLPGRRRLRRRRR